MDKKQAMNLIIDELGRATAARGNFKSLYQGYAVLLEELDELWDDIKRDQPGRMLAGEAKQVGAMALKLLGFLDGDADLFGKKDEYDKFIDAHDGYAALKEKEYRLRMAIFNQYPIDTLIDRVTDVAFIALKFLQECC
jgi:hypothetical protein